MDLTDDEIFFGSERCFFRPSSGSTEVFSTEDYCFASDLHQVQQQAAALSQRHKVEGHDLVVVVPGIPALDIIPLVTSTRQESQTSHRLPDIFHSPLVKCPRDHPECLRELYGVKSGVRSGLIRHDGVWYRLKGCGNNDEGFVLRVHHTPAAGKDEESKEEDRDRQPWQEIRGCAFHNTALRELYFTGTVSVCPSLHEKGVISANQSLGLSLYSHPFETVLGLPPPVRPVCIVESTRGDRRLGSHVLAGIELILPLLLDVEAVDVTLLAAVFPPNRPRERLSGSVAGVEGGRWGDEAALSSLAEVVSTDRFLCDYCLGTSMAGSGDDPGCQGLCWPQAPRDASTLANMLLPGHTLPLQTPSCRSASSSADVASASPAEGGEDEGEGEGEGEGGGGGHPQQWTNAGPVDMPPSWQAVWDKTVAELAAHLTRIHARQTSAPVPCLGRDPSTPCSAVLAYLYACVGYDAGNILRGLHDKRVSWGTYQDALCRSDLDEWHCNAHSNNLVLLPPTTSTTTTSTTTTTPLLRQPPPPLRAEPPMVTAHSSARPQDQHARCEAHKQHQPMLSFLDLDMAYTADTFLTVNSDDDSVKVGVSDEVFKSVLWKEYVNLMEVLAGSDASSGVPQVARSALLQHCAVVQAVRSALADTLVLAFMDSYQGRRHEHSGEAHDADLHAAAYCVMKLGVVVMAPFVV